MELASLSADARARAVGAALSAGLAVALCFAYGVRDRPLLADTQLYYFIGERAASGVPPHVSQVDIKTSLGPIASGLAIRAGRALGVDDVAASRAVSVAAAAASVALAFLLAAQFSGSLAAGAVAAAALLSTNGFFFEASTGSSPKVFLVPLLLAAHLAAARRRWSWSGIAAAAAFFCWQPGGVVVGSAGLALLLDRRSRWSDAVRFAVGVAVTALAYEGYFWWHGALAEQLHQEFVLAFESVSRPFDAAEAFWFFLTEARAWQQTPNAAPAGFFVVGALLALALAVRPRRALDLVRTRPGEVSFWTAAAVGTAFTLREHQAHPDMMLVQPAFAVACGVGAGWIVSIASRVRFGAWVATALAAAVVVAFLADAQKDARSAAPRSPKLDDQRTLANLLDVYRDHRGSVWVVGAAHLLGLEREDNWVPHAYLAGPITSEIDFHTWRPLRDGRMPEILLVSRGIFPGSKAWLRPEYEEITPAAFAAQRIRVYARKQRGVSGPKPYPVAKSPSKAGAGKSPAPSRPPPQRVPPAGASASSPAVSGSPDFLESERGVRPDESRASGSAPAASSARAAATRP